MRSYLLNSLCRSACKQNFFCNQRYSALIQLSCLRRMVSFTPNDRARRLKPQYSKDCVDTSYSLVYENRGMRFLWPSRLFITSVCCVSASAGLVVFFVNHDVSHYWDLAFYLTFSGLNLAFMAFTNWMSRFYLRRIYFNADNQTFIGVFPSLLGKTQQIKYSQSDFRAPLVGKVAAKSNVVIKEKIVQLRAEDFVLPKYYNMHIQQ